MGAWRSKISEKEEGLGAEKSRGASPRLCWISCPTAEGLGGIWALAARPHGPLGVLCHRSQGTLLIQDPQAPGRARMGTSWSRHYLGSPKVGASQGNRNANDGKQVHQHHLSTHFLRTTLAYQAPQGHLECLQEARPAVESDSTRLVVTVGGVET